MNFFDATLCLMAFSAVLSVGVLVYSLGVLTKTLKEHRQWKQAQLMMTHKSWTMCSSKG